MTSPRFHTCFSAVAEIGHDGNVEVDRLFHSVRGEAPALPSTTLIQKSILLCNVVTVYIAFSIYSVHWLLFKPFVPITGI